MKKYWASILFLSSTVMSASLCAEVDLPQVTMFELKINMYDVSQASHKKLLGFINVAQTPEGLRFTPNLSGLTPGFHGFHVHEKPNCSAKEKDGKVVAAGAAGTHFDPENTQQHGLPTGGGHLGDLPPLFFDENQQATQAVVSTRLKMTDLSGRALIIHAGGDNHSDHPMPLGGGGARVACGFIGY